jgi:CubicO group peptidase (beta-lactamase class C family)
MPSVPHWWTSQMADVQARVQAAIDEMVACGTETGLQVAVLRGGQVAAEAVSGVADPDTGAAVRVDTLFYAASTAKGVAASLAHVLAERGDLDYDMTLASVWPEFGSRGKERVTVRHVLLHTAGLPALPPGTTPADLCDWEYMCAVLAAQEPWWEPGTRFGYHALTFGFLLGEVIRRVTGRTVTELLRKLVTGPLGVQDEVCFGVPPALLPRVAKQVPGDGSPPVPPQPGSVLDRAMPRGVRPDAAFANRADVLTSDIPSMGTMTARGVARMYSALLGHVDGVALVSAARLAAMTTVAFTGTDEVMGFPTSWAFGYSPDRPGGVPSRRGSTFGMVGSNGSAAYADVDSGVAVAVMHNRFTPGDLSAVTRIDRIVAELLP